METYKKVILLIGGSHQLRVHRRLIGKRHSCKGYTEKSQDIIIENVRLHKESFSALIQLRVKAITYNFTKVLPELIEQFLQVQTDPTPKYLHNVVNNELFMKLCRKVMHIEKGSEHLMAVAYLKDVSALLGLVSTVREGDFEGNYNTREKC